MEIQRRGDKLYLVGEWPQKAEITAELLAGADQNIVSQRENELILALENGTAVYKIISFDMKRCVYQLELESGYKHEQSNDEQKLE